jgi:archaellum component FlaF (FlaF/FlaG flagellin family)
MLNRLTKAKILIKLDLLHNGNIIWFNLFAVVLFPLQNWLIFFESWSASLSAKHADQLSL